MRRWGLIGALVLVVLVNAVVLAGVAWNRAGEPVAALVLTERELPLPASGLMRRENSGVALLLKVSYRSRAPAWLDAAKLEELGFDPEQYAAQRERGERYQKWPLPRSAYVVLEYDGPAWARLLKAREAGVARLAAQVEAGTQAEGVLVRARQQLERMRTAESRLVPIDAGNDPALLRARYSDGSRYIVTRAEIQMRYGLRPTYREQQQDDQRVFGFVRHILPGSLYVPLEFHDALESALDSPRSVGGQGSTAPGARIGTPRYEVDLRYGQRYEPWIVQVSEL